MDKDRTCNQESAGHAFTFRYGVPICQQRQGGTARSVCSLYLNRYSLMGTASASIYGRDGLGALLFSEEPGFDKTDSLSDFLRLLSYKLGLLNVSDLSYYLGLDRNVLHNQLGRLNRIGAFRSYKGVPSYAGSTYHIIDQTGQDYRYLVDSGIETSFPFTAKYIPRSSLPHTYGCSLSQMLIRLYRLAGRDYTMTFSTERSIGNLLQSARGKQIAEVTIDALGRIQHPDGHESLLCVEYDTGTERYTTLLQKFRDYGYTELYTEKAAKQAAILFSYSESGASAKFNMTLSPYLAYAALYALLYICITECDRISAISSVPLLPYCRELADVHRTQDRVRELAEPYVRGLCREICHRELYLTAGISENVLYDVLFSPAIVHHKAFEEFTYLTGSRDHLGRYLASDSTLNTLQDYIISLKDIPEGILIRLDYNMRMYGQCSKRRKGLVKAILKEISAETRRIDRHLDRVYEAEGIPLPDNRVHFSPLLAGYSCYMYPLQLITNQMPYVLWDRQSQEILRVERIIREYIGENLYKVLPDEPILTAAGDKIRFRNSYSSMNDSGDSVSLCIHVEDLADIGAQLRIIRGFSSLFLPKHDILIVILVDNWLEARDFENKFLSLLPGYILDQTDRFPQTYGEIPFSSWALATHFAHIAYLNKYDSCDGFLEDKFYLLDCNGRPVPLSTE